jgi:hypothetical protein
MQFALSTVSSEWKEENGIEIYVFEVATSGIQSALKRAERIGPNDKGLTIKEFFCSMYSISNRPNPSQILHAALLPASVPHCTKVVLKIKRGAERIAEFVKEHSFHRTADIYNIMPCGIETIGICCSCGDRIELDARSL